MRRPGTCAQLSDRFAPEHLELLVERPQPLADRIINAGAIFIGPWSPEAVGDYLAGPNHTLPTCAAARFSGALCVETFMRHTSMIAFNRAALEATGAVEQLAEAKDCTAMPAECGAPGLKTSCTRMRLLRRGARLRTPAT